MIKLCSPRFTDSLSTLLGRRGLLFVCTHARDGGLAARQDRGRKGENALRDESGGSEMGQALSMGTPLVFRLSRHSHCCSGGVDSEALRWLDLRCRVPSSLLLILFLDIIWDHSIDVASLDAPLFEIENVGYSWTLATLNLCCIYIHPSDDNTHMSRCLGPRSRVRSAAGVLFRLHSHFIINNRTTILRTRS